MPCRQTIYAQKVRRELIRLMGGCCAICGLDDADDFEFDHPFGRDWEPNAKSYSARMAQYRREFHAGLLRLLCTGCNQSERKRVGQRFVPTCDVMRVATETIQEI